jgi:hypothetical protein
VTHTITTKYHPVRAICSSPLVFTIVLLLL